MITSLSTYNESITCRRSNKCDERDKMIKWQTWIIFWNVKKNIFAMKINSIFFPKQEFFILPKRDLDVGHTTCDGTNTVMYIGGTSNSSILLPSNYPSSSLSLFFLHTQKKFFSDTGDGVNKNKKKESRHHQSSLLLPPKEQTEE